MSRTPYARHKNPLNSEMNVVPYIDVMLVLLIIFMVTAPMLTTGVEIDLPKEKTQNIAKDDKQLPVIVSLNKDGELFLSHDTVIDEPMTEQALLDKLTDLAKAKQGNDGKSTLQVMVNADANNEYRAIMHLMARLQQAGISKVGLLTDNPKSQKSK